MINKEINLDSEKPILFKFIKFIRSVWVTKISFRYFLLNCQAVDILLIVLITTACGVKDTEPSDLGDLTGVWELTTTVSSSTCGLSDGSSSSEWITLIQCGDEISIITGEGLWGSGAVSGDQLNFTGTENQTDGMGCLTTYNHLGTFSGTSSTLEGTFTTNVTFDPGSCGNQTTCTIKTSARISLIDTYLNSCIDRDKFGDPAESEYILPWPAGKTYVLNNSYCVPTGGHREQQAYDFLIPIGDTILAARGGVIRQIREDSPDDGQGNAHNHVMVEHDDGTVGFYAHLKQEGILLEMGENVETGQPIALAGHSGTTDVVHLHFGVYSNYPPVEGYDRAINFNNMDGPLDCLGGLVTGGSYTAR